MKKRYASRFIVDVIETDIEIVLKDTSGIEYHISKSNAEIMAQYNNWFTNTFLKGISQTITVFEYIVSDISECEIELQIVKFLH